MQLLASRAEQALGLQAYCTDTPGIGGRLRTEPEDFVVVETGAGPPEVDGGSFAAARIRLRNWETNRFVGHAAKAVGVPRSRVAFAGMKDKRAVTVQWFTFRCGIERLQALAGLQDVEVLDVYPTRKGHHAGAHTGNRFEVRVREAEDAKERVPEILRSIRADGGVPNFFGPQRFGSIRPITHLVGEAIVAGDLEEAVRLYLGNPIEGERAEAYEARRVYEETRDPEAALAAYPHRLDPERAMLKRLVREPGNWRRSLTALPRNLLQLFVHAHQSYLFNRILSARIEAGLALRTAHVGDLVMAAEDDGVVHAVRDANQQRVQEELDKGRAFLTAPLVGHGSGLATGAPGEVEQRVLDEEEIVLDRFRTPQLPQVASAGRRRAMLQPVHDLDVQWLDGDPVFHFRLGRGSYATTVLREFMKTDLGSY